MSARRVDDFPAIVSIDDLKRVRRERSEMDVWNLLFEFSRTKLVALLMEVAEE